MSSVNALLAVMRQLRDPEQGCPWDKQQDFHSLSAYTIEEAYEVVDAIERKNFADLRDELGDLLYQVVFHAAMAEEAGHFSFDDVVKQQVEKLKRRHPHVFSTVSVNSSDEAADIWEQQKIKEKNDQQVSVLDAIAKNLPALKRAKKLQQRAASVGFDWPDINPVFEKIDEELAEFREALAQGSIEDLDEELGDFLFVVVNLARHASVDAEQSLLRANNKFQRRFSQIEEKLKVMDKDIKNVSLAELDALWDQVKLEEKSKK